MPLFGTLVTEQGHLFLKKAFRLRKGENGTMELKIEHLCKQFKDKKAVDDASLTLTPGTSMQMQISRFTYIRV